LRASLQLLLLVLLSRSVVMPAGQVRQAGRLLYSVV
jgi:hypothetical protein